MNRWPCFYSPVASSFVNNTTVVASSNEFFLVATRPLIIRLPVVSLHRSSRLLRNRLSCSMKIVSFPFICIFILDCRMHTYSAYVILYISIYITMISPHTPQLHINLLFLDSKYYFQSSFRISYILCAGIHSISSFEKQFGSFFPSGHHRVSPSEWLSPFGTP